jgi:putative restriction endonuclease
MRYWVANTDLDWFNYLASVAPDDVNFWQPNAVRPITLDRGAPWLFKLHNRQGGWIVGGGFFAHYTTMTPRFAWDAFGNANGAQDFDRFVRDVRRHSERELDPDATQVGATILVQPFFLPQEHWIGPPDDWSSNLTRGKSYDTEVGEGSDCGARFKRVFSPRTRRPRSRPQKARRLPMALRHSSCLGSGKARSE